MRVASAAVVASLAAGAIATEYKTVYVTEYTTVCPKATSLATGPGAGSGSGAQTTPAAAQVRSSSFSLPGFPVSIKHQLTLIRYSLPPSPSLAPPTPTPLLLSPRP